MLQLPTDAIPLLVQAVEAGSRAVGVCAASRAGATACNVECEVAGSDPVRADNSRGSRGSHTGPLGTPLRTPGTLKTQHNPLKTLLGPLILASGTFG